ncbi:MAG: DUF2520 domain-containing protein [Bacteroidales bacterium]|nr:DUF2520 domain-containing protein [Bacteroidales bacterium]
MLQFGKIAVIGAGNVAYTLCNVMKDKGINPYCVFVRDKNKAAQVGEELGVEAVSDYKKVLESDFIIISVNDDSISDVAAQLIDYKGIVVHTSGTKPSTVLNKIARFGVFYPLQTMSKNRKIRFDDVPLLIFANTEDDLATLKEFAELFSNNVIVCDDEQRKAIHLSAVFVSNFTNVMLGIGDKLLKEKGLPLTIMKPLVMEMMEKSFETLPQKALTGPARRGDFATIGEHEKMLSYKPDELAIYMILTDYITEKYNKTDEEL